MNKKNPEIGRFSGRAFFNNKKFIGKQFHTRLLGITLRALGIFQLKFCNFDTH